MERVPFRTNLCQLSLRVTLCRLERECAMQMTKRILIASMAIAAGLTAAYADSTMDGIKAKGKLVVGVKADYKPYGFLEPSGKIVGLEPDLATDVAKRLNVSVELVPVQASNRIQFLQQGKIDLLIATMADTPERAAVIDIPKPSYYASYANMMAVKDTPLKQWEDLRGKPICAITGGFYNQVAGERYGANLIAFKGTAEAFRALQTGNCLGFMYDDTFLVSSLQEPEWTNYKLALPSIEPIAWGVGVRKGEADFGKFMSDTITDWHRTGFIVGLEKKWNIQTTPFVKEANEKYK